jgi:hypothetical protein
MDNDIVPAAEMLALKFGDSAALLAAERARTLLDEGVQEGGLLWIQIARAIDALGVGSPRRATAAAKRDWTASH